MRSISILLSVFVLSVPGIVRGQVYPDAIPDDGDSTVRRVIVVDTNTMSDTYGNGMWDKIFWSDIFGTAPDSIIDLNFAKDDLILPEDRDHNFNENYMSLNDAAYFQIHRGSLASLRVRGDASGGRISFYGPSTDWSIGAGVFEVNDLSDLLITPHSEQVGKIVFGDHAYNQLFHFHSSTGETRFYSYGSGTFADTDDTYITSFDASGNVQEMDSADLADFVGVDPNTDNQVIDTFLLDGTDLNLSISGDNEPFKVVDLSSLSGSGITFGTRLEIPFVNDTEDDFNYTDNFKYDNGTLRLTGVAGSNNREEILNLDVSDDAGSRFDVYNITQVNNTFRPGFQGYSSSHAFAPIYFTGVSSAAQDAGAHPMMQFVGRTATNPIGGPYSAVTTRPIVAFDNQADRLLLIEADGQFTNTNYGAGTFSDNDAAYILGADASNNIDEVSAANLANFVEGDLQITESQITDLSHLTLSIQENNVEKVAAAESIDFDDFGFIITGVSNEAVVKLDTAQLATLYEVETNLNGIFSAANDGATSPGSFDVDIETQFTFEAGLLDLFPAGDLISMYQASQDVKLQVFGDQDIKKASGDGTTMITFSNNDHTAQPPISFPTAAGGIASVADIYLYIDSDDDGDFGALTISADGQTPSTDTPLMTVFESQSTDNEDNGYVRFEGGIRNSQNVTYSGASNQTLDGTNFYWTYTGSTGITVNLPNIPGAEFRIANAGSVSITLDPTSGNINGAATYTLTAGSGVIVYKHPGSDYFAK